MRLIEKVWFQGHSAKWLLVPLLAPFSLVFWLLTAIRRLCYRINLKKSVRLPVPVIIVGNIGIGGNGKTPLAVYLIEQCKALGINVGVISRGYGGNAEQYPYLLNEQSNAEQAGDEPFLIFQRCHVPVCVGPDRIACANQLIAQGCELIIADDGLQHYRLQRDLEVIVIDGNRLFGNGLLLPAGPLREGKWRLDDSDCLIVNGGNNQKKLISQSYISMNLQAQELVNLKTGVKLGVNDFLSSHPKVNALAGIGDPARFFNTLTQLGIEVVESKGFVDHQAYQASSFDEFNTELPLLMTEKDAVKCVQFANDNWWYLPVAAQFESEEIGSLLSTIKQLVKRHN